MPNKICSTGGLTERDSPGQRAAAQSVVIGITETVTAGPAASHSTRKGKEDRTSEFPLVVSALGL